MTTAVACTHRDSIWNNVGRWTSTPVPASVDSQTVWECRGCGARFLDIGGSKVNLTFPPSADREGDLLNLQYRRDTAVAVLEAMDVDQYLIDAVRDASPQSDGAGALPTSPSPEVGVATSPPASSPLVGPAITPAIPPGTLLRTVADAVVAKRHDDGSPFTITDLVAAYNGRIGVGADGNGQAYQNGRIQGESHLRSVLVEKLMALQVRAITSAEKYQLGLALDAVRAEL